MRRIKILTLISVLILSVMLSLSPLSVNLDKLILGHFLGINEKNHARNDMIVVKIDKSVVKENKLWPWKENWPEYLLAFLMDLKPEKIILGPEFLDSISDLSFLDNFLKRGILVISAPEMKKLPSTIKINGHLHINNWNGYYSSLLAYNSLPLLKINPKLDIKGDKFYFLPLTDIPNVVAAKDIALAGFLRGEEFEGFNLSSIAGKLIFLEVSGQKLMSEVSLLCAQLNNTIFYLLPPELSLYFGLFLFVVIYILCKKLKFRPAFLIFAISIISVALFHYGYFHTRRTYFEIIPVGIFLISSFGTALIEKEIQNRKEKKYRKEMQVARLFKEKEILPVTNISSDGVAVSITRYKMDKVGGDFYQFLEFSKGELGIILGWVPDDGIERVKYIMEVVHGWRDFATVYKEPAKVIQVLNNSLFRFGEQGKYATLIYMVFDAKKSTLKYVNAGHDPFILLRSTGFVKVIEADEPTPVGIARDISFKENEMILYPGDSVIAFSGGISKIIQEKEGIKREFLDSLKSYLEYQPQEFCNHIFNALVKTYPHKPDEEWSLLTMKVE